MATTISHQRERIRSIESPSIYAWLFCVFGLSAFFIVDCLPDVGPVPFFKDIAVFIFGSMQNVHIAFAVVLTAHTTLALCAWLLAKKVDPENVSAWFWQTLLLATFSYRLLVKRAQPKT